MLTVAGFACTKDNLQEIYEMDFPMRKYKIPNYCITDPVFFKDYKQYENNNNSVENVIINIKCFITNDMKEINLKISNKSNGKDVKQQLAKIENKKLDLYKCRLFFQGQEILDEHQLFYHNLKDNSKIQVLFNKIN